MIYLVTSVGVALVVVAVVLVDDSPRRRLMSSACMAAGFAVLFGLMAWLWLNNR